MAQKDSVEGSPTASVSEKKSGGSLLFFSPALAKSHSVPIAELMERTGYSIAHQDGQRRYGPPPDWDGSRPPKGSEVFVCHIPRNCFEDELVPVFEKVGRIYEMRLKLNSSGYNRGYAFVVYSSPSEAKECVRALNNFEIRKGQTLVICMSVDKCRLFVGGINNKMTKDEIYLEMQKVTEGVVDVTLYPSAADKTKNRGYAFVEYNSHMAAVKARWKLIQHSGGNLNVKWAVPELEIDEEVMAQVKRLYVRNLMLSTTENEIEEAFGTHAAVEHVKKIGDYAFLHFTSKEDAHTAMEAMNGTMLDGAQIEVSLAKPVDQDSRSLRQKNPLTVPVVRYIPVDQYGGMVPVFYPGYYSPPKYMMQNKMGWSGRERGHGFYQRSSLPEILEEICQKNNWGSPLYTLHSSPGAMAEPLFLYKVTIAAMGTTYIPSKLSRRVEEAQSIAAEYTLVQLGYSMEAAGYSPSRGMALTKTPVQSTPMWAPAEPTIYAQPYADSSFTQLTYNTVYQPGT